MVDRPDMRAALSGAVPELPVRSVVDAQSYYRDRLGFGVEWHHQEGRIGAVVRDACTLFFRETSGEIAPAVLWVFTEDVDQTYAELCALGAEIADPLADKPWGLRQFTIRDLHGHRIHFHHDL